MWKIRQQEFDPKWNAAAVFTYICMRNDSEINYVYFGTEVEYYTIIQLLLPLNEKLVQSGLPDAC